ncbi:MAG: TraR/DksA family transcriptional regulator [Actinomycetota bacterium]|nr:TraR/DksA family transcriptional regulator [Actinomycetota bacterium]
MSAVDVEHFRGLLAAERERVVAAIEYLHEENPGSIEDETGELVSGSADNHMGDTATVTFDRELDYTLEENSEHVLAEIDAALGRIEDGTFGACRSCGRPIAPERLEAIPWATQCIDCRRREERQ